MGNFSKKNSQSGQIVLVVILAAVISLTVGLSVASRVINNTKSNTDETNSQKALSAAEAGIQKQLASPVSHSSVDFGNSSVSYTSQDNAATEFLLNGGELITQNDAADIWLSDYGNGDEPTYSNPSTLLTLAIYWTDNNDTDCTKNAAIEVVVISGTKNAPTISRTGYDTCASRKQADGFTDTVSATNKTISNVQFDHKALIDIDSGLVARVIPLYANTKIGADFFNQGTSNSYARHVPAQGRVIESTGTSGDSTRKLRVFQGYPKLPIEVFPYSLFFPNI